MEDHDNFRASFHFYLNLISFKEFLLANAASKIDLIDLCTENYLTHFRFYGIEFKLITEDISAP